MMQRSPIFEAALVVLLVFGPLLVEVRADQASDVYKILEQAHKTASIIRDADEKYATLADIAKARAMFGDVEGALQIAADILHRGHKARALNAIAKVQAVAGHRASAQKIFQEALQAATAFRGASKDTASIFLDIAGAQAKAGDQTARKTLRQAVKAAATIQDASDKGWSLSAIAQAQAEAGDIEGARQTVAAINDFFKRYQVLGKVAQAQAEAGDIEGARQTVTTIKSSSSTAHALVAVAKAQAKAGHWPVATDTLRQALHSTANMSDDEKGRALWAIAEAQDAMGDQAAAVATLESALSLSFGVDISPSHARVVLGIARAQTEAYAAVEARRVVANALGLLVRLNGLWCNTLVCDSYSRDDALEFIARLQLDIADVDGARQTVAAMQDDYTKAHNLIDVAKAQAEAGDVEGARQTADAIQVKGYRAAARSGIAAAQAKAGDMAGALAWVSVLGDPAERASVLLGVAQGLLKRKSEKKP